MSGRGVHFALTLEDVAALKAQPSDEDRLTFISGEIEERYFDEWPDRVAETDKAWDAIHRVLSGGTLGSPPSAYPLTHVILGGEQLYSGPDYILSLTSPADVQAAAAALENVSGDELHRRYLALDPNDYDGEIGEEDWAYTWDWFQVLREFWMRAAASGHHVVFTADQ